MKKFITVFLLILVFVLAFSACNSASNPGYSADIKPGGVYDSTDKSGDEVYSDAVIKTANVSAQTKEFDSAISSLSALITQNGGYVFSSSVAKNPGYGESKVVRYAQYVIKIPSKNLDAFLSGLEGFLAVTSLDTRAQDVSEELYDLESAIETLEKKRATLRAMLDTVDSAKQWDYYWQISNELDAVETQLAKLEASLSELEGKIAYSTVQLYISEVTVISEAAEPTFVQQIADAFGASLTGLLEIAKGLIIAIVFMLPFTVSGGIIAFLIVLIIKLSIRSRRKKAEKKNDQK